MTETPSPTAHAVVPSIDLKCFELPVVIVTPTKERLPEETCNQKRAPALDCMKEPVKADIEVVDNANGTLNCMDGERTAVYHANVHYRGQSSLHFSKHSMAVDLDEDTELLGFPADKGYVLHGPAIDGSLMRNHLAHWLFRGTQRYSPRTRHVVVFIRDSLDVEDSSPQHHGIYLAMEKISYGANRVGLAPLNGSCSGDDELSGGWAWQNNPLEYGVYSPNMLVDKYETLFGSGERPVLTFPPADTMTQSMRSYFVAPETGPLPRLYRHLYENMTQPDQLQDHIDLGSFVDYLLHTELAQNSDAYRRSAYFFKDRGQPINAGPVWDFNLAYGRGANQQDWLFKPFSFWKRVMCNYRMAALVPKRWRQLRADVWSDDAIRAFVDASAEPLARQLQKCPGGEKNWRSRALQCANVKVHGLYQQHVDALKRAVIGRAYWMDQNVGSFYKKLDHMVCVVAGDLPEYNCARNGSDAGCLSFPEKYLDTVEFPPIHKPSSSDTRSNYACSQSNLVTETPTVDHCWLAAGVYVGQGSITPFCSGYGSCPSGPGATCTCLPGHFPPACERSDDPIDLPGRFADNAALAEPVPGRTKQNQDDAPQYAFVGLSALLFVAFVVFNVHKRRVGKRSLLQVGGVAGSGSSRRNGRHIRSPQRSTLTLRLAEKEAASMQLVAGVAALLLLALAANATRLSSSFDESDTCFALPVVLITPEDGDAFPEPSCQQLPVPGRDCMKRSVAASVEVIDNGGVAGNEFVNCLNASTRVQIKNASAHYRGQSSLRFRKHQLGLNLAASTSTNASSTLPTASFLGFSPGREFVLNGPWIDCSLLRNHLAHWLFRRTGRYSPRSRHAAVFMSETATSPLEYHGIYLALEQISYEQDEHRVRLARMDATCRSLHELSGGWAWQFNPLDFGAFAPNLAVDKYSLAFASGSKPRLMYPRGQELTQEMRDHFVSPTTGPLPRLYQFLYENMTSAPERLGELVDLGSFADYLLHSELSLNTDAFRKSTFFFQDRGQPINAGPVWDFNLAYGQGAANGAWLFAKFPLWARLVCHYEFAALLPKRWRALRTREWSDEAMLQFVNASAVPITRQVETLCQSEWSSADVGCANVKSLRTFDDEVRLLTDALRTRAHWMDERLVRGHLFRSLDAATCGNVPATDASPLPEFNCAMDGGDSGCLADPDAYIAAARFPAARSPYRGPQCSSPAVEPASVDYCWLSMGDAPGLGLTPFCSGHGTCESGPSAECQCADGYSQPACEAASGRLTGGVGSEGTWLGGEAALWMSLLAITVCMGVCVRRRRGYEGVEETTRVTRGPVADYGAAA